MNNENVRLTEWIRRRMLVPRRIKYVIESRLRYLIGDHGIVRKEILLYSGRFISPNHIKWIP